MIIKADDHPVRVQYKDPSKYYNAAPFDMGAELGAGLGANQVAAPFDEVTVEVGQEYKVVGTLISAKELGLGPDTDVESFSA